MEMILQITDLSRGGAGVAREETGRVVFVPFTAPGDRVRVRLLEVDRRYAQAELLEILESSSVRQTAPCSVFGRCGGCQWQHIPYSVQWETKTKGVLHALDRMKVPLLNSVAELLPAEKVWNYRNRIQLRGFNDEIGFYAAQSNTRVPIKKCWIAREELNQAIPQAIEKGKSLTQPYKVELEVLPNGDVKDYWNQGHSAGGFRQVHDEQNTKLRSWVSSNISSKGWVLDLFGGDGNLGGPISLAVEGVDCVDFSAPEGTTHVDFPRLKFHRGSVLKWLRRSQNASEKKLYEAAIFDPPREGLGDDLKIIAEAIEKFGVREVIAVGCDPDSWARDLSAWTRRGWRVDKIGILDLFPQTPHVESLARLIL